MTDLPSTNESIPSPPQLETTHASVSLNKKEPQNDLALSLASTPGNEGVMQTPRSLDQNGYEIAKTIELQAWHRRSFSPSAAD